MNASNSFYKFLSSIWFCVILSKEVLIREKVYNDEIYLFLLSVVHFISFHFSEC